MRRLILPEPGGGSHSSKRGPFFNMGLMNHIIRLVTALTVLLLIHAAAQTYRPVISSQWAYGGSANDVPYRLEVLPDGGKVVGGESSSSDGAHTSPAYGGRDFWVVRLDASGAVLWNRGFGGAGDDRLYALALAGSNRIILAGSSSSPASTGNKTSPNYGLEDFWVILVDEDGQQVWQRSFGGAGTDFATCVAQTADGGFVVAGYSQSPAGQNKDAPLRGQGDFWLVRLDADGNQLWDRSYGGGGDDGAFSLLVLPDGALVLAGNSDSQPGDLGSNKTSAAYGFYDLWVLGLDISGSILWEKSYGGDSDDGYYNVSLARSLSGDLFLAADSFSGATGNKTSPGFGTDDFWILRLNTSGNRLWETNCGGMDNDYPLSLLPTADDGCLVAGGSNSRVSGNKTDAGRGSTDFWLTKLDAQGHPQWDKAAGGTGADAFLALGIGQTADGTLVCCGDSVSGADGDKTVPPLGGSDFWLLTLHEPVPPTLEIGMEAGAIQVVLKGEIGSTYVTEASADLGVWTPVSTNHLTQASAVIPDPDQAGKPRRYYRAWLAQ